MAKRTVGELYIDKPAMGIKAFEMTCPHPDNLAAKKTCRVDQMAAMRQHVILLQIGLGVAVRLSPRVAFHN